MEQPIKIKIIKNQVEQTEKIEKIEKTEPIIDEVSNGTGPSTPLRVSRTIWERIGEVCFYLLVVLAPLFFLPWTIAPVEINKQVFAGILVLIAFVCYLINAFKKEKIVYPKSWLSLAVAVLLVVFGISTLFSQARAVSFWGNLVRPDSFVSFLIYGLAFFVAAVFYSEEQTNRIKKTAFCFFAGLALVTIFGFLQIFGKFILPWDFSRQANFNPVGTILNWAIYIAFGLVMIIGLLLDKRKGINNLSKIGLIGLALLIFLELFLLNYPVIWLTLAFLTLLLAAYKFINIGKLNPGLIAIVVFFLFLGFISKSLPSLVSIPLEFRPSLSATWRTAVGPLKQMEQIGLIRKIGQMGRIMLIGNGPATFGYNYALYRPIELNQTNLWPIRFNQGFSFLTTLLSTAGLLGILTIIGLMVLALIMLIKPRGETEWNRVVILTGVLFLLVSSLFTPIFFTQFLFIFLGLGLIAALFGNTKEISLAGLSKIKTLIIFVVLIILIAGDLAFVFQLGRKYLGAVYYEKGVRIYNQTGDLNKALIRLDKARQLDSRQDQYFQTFSQTLLLKADKLIRQGAGELSVEALRLEIQNTVALAIETGRRATNINPVDSLNWSNLANIYEKIIPISQGADVFVEENYKKAMALDPKNPQEPVNLARSFLVASDLIGSTNPSLWQEKLNKAKSYLEQSIALKSDYAPAHFLLAVAAMREGRTQEAIARLELTKGMAPFDAGLAFQLGVVYYQNNQLEKAQAEFERAVGIDPNFSNARYFLGLIYDRFGNKQAALEQFERIAQLNPGNEEIKKILNNLWEGRGALEGIVPPAQPPAERLETPVPE